jgi:hypothetical protein
MDVKRGTRLGTLNLARYCRFLAEHAQGGDVEERDGIVLFAGGHAYPGTHTNGVIRTSKQLPADEVLAEADRWFRPKKRGYTVWTCGDPDADIEAMVTARGLLQRPPEQGMAYMLTDRRVPTEEFSAPAGAEIVKVEDEATAHDYLKVVAEAFGMKGLSTTIVAKLFFDPTTLLHQRCSAYVAYVDGEPVSGVLMWFDGDFAGTYSGVSSPSSLSLPIVFRAAARGRGLAKSCLCMAINDGFDMGARFGGGTATPDGQAAWAAVGFETTAFFHRYIRRPPF